MLERLRVRPKLGGQVRRGGVLKGDGAVVANNMIPHTIAFVMVCDESFDVGVDTRTQINPKDYQVPFGFDGTIDKLTCE